MSPKNEGARIVELDASGEGGHALSPTRRGGFAQTGEFADNEPTLGEYIGTILESRVLVAAITACAVVLAALYLFFAAPTFRSDALLQVEDKSKGIAGLDDLSSVFSEKAPADTEIEILRSRSLLGSVVDDLNLTIEARPRTFPVFGGALFRRHGDDDLASPFLGMNSFAWGGERIQVSRLQVPDDLLGEQMVLTAEGNHFTIRGPKGQVRVSDQVGKPAAHGEG